VAAGFPIAWIALLALAKDPAAAGDPIPIRVEFDAPAGCPDVEAFYAGVLTRSDRARRAGAREEGVRLGVRLTRAGGKVHGELRVLDGRSDSDTRKMEGVRCDEVVEVLSLTAALAIDPAARMTPSRPAARAAPGATTAAAPAAPPATTPAPPPASPTPPPPPPTEIETPPPAPTPPAATAAADAGRSAPSTLGFSLGASTLGAMVISPSFAFGGAVSARFGRIRDDGAGASISIAALYLSNDLLQPATDLATALTGASLTACPGLGVGSTVVLEACARVIGGWLAATGRGVTNPSSIGRSWWSAGAIARLGILLGAGFSLEAEAGLGVPLVRRTFFTETPEVTVGETPTISAMAGIGVARRL
jgi:hypothetical protein